MGKICANFQYGNGFRTRARQSDYGSNPIADVGSKVFHLKHFTLETNLTKKSNRSTFCNHRDP